ncbi:MAG: DUF362 domain-containing protein [Deltaproteobacteria bacterium]|nr:DUF362 domain-containing protein [Deltaproteobacteria bacterium]
MLPKVALRRCGTYETSEVYNTVKESVGLLGGIGSFVKKGEKILIKPNLLSAKSPDAAITTHPSFVKAVIRLVKEAGAYPVVGDSPGMGSTAKVAARCGILDVCKEEDIPLVEFRQSIEIDNPDGKTFKRFEIAKEVLDVDGIINLPKLKTHTQMFMTLGVKNMFGCIVGTRKAQWHLSAGSDREHFARMLVDLYLFLKPRLTIVDGIIGLEGEGPGSSGKPRHLGLVLASQDAIALDRVVMEIIGAKPDNLYTCKVARDDGLGETDIKRIDVLGDSIQSVFVRDFVFPKIVDIAFSLPYNLNRHLKKHLTAKPYINKKICTLCKMCVDLCPPHIMKKIDNAIEIDYDNCIRCFCCQEICPEGAIRVKEGWLMKVLLK